MCVSLVTVASPKVRISPIGDRLVCLHRPEVSLTSLTKALKLPEGQPCDNKITLLLTPRTAREELLRVSCPSARTLVSNMQRKVSVPGVTKYTYAYAYAVSFPRQLAFVT